MGMRRVVSWCVLLAVGGAVTSLRAGPAGAGAVRVVWTPARRRGALTHYELHIRELAKYAPPTHTISDTSYIHFL